MGIGKIVEGGINLIKENLELLKEDEIKEIERRREICKNCPLNSENAKKAGWYASYLPYVHCTVCKCHIEAKTACLSCNCGAELDPNLEIKWTEYKTNEE